MPMLYRSRVILGFPMEPIPELIAGALGVQSKMSEHASIFVAPNPSMSVLLNQITDVQTTHQTVKSTRATGAAAARGVKVSLLWSSLETERSIVQSLCDASPGSALDIANMAGMTIATRNPYQKPILKGALTTTPGSVALEANVSLLVGAGMAKAKKRCFLWRYTLDGGKTFVLADPTAVGRTVIPNLPPATLVGFQVAVKDAVGPGAWSQTFTLFIH